MGLIIKGTIPRVPPFSPWTNDSMAFRIIKHMCKHCSFFMCFFLHLFLLFLKCLHLHRPLSRKTSRSVTTTPAASIEIVRATSWAIRCEWQHCIAIQLYMFHVFFVRCFFDTCQKTAHHCSQSCVKATWSSRIWINMRINPFASNFFHSCVNDTGLIWKPQVHTGITVTFSKIRPLWWLINQGPWLWHDKWPTNFGYVEGKALIASWTGSEFAFQPLLITTHFEKENSLWSINRSFHMCSKVSKATMWHVKQNHCHWASIQYGKTIGDQRMEINPPWLRPKSIRKQQLIPHHINISDMILTLY